MKKKVSHEKPIPKIFDKWFRNEVLINLFSKNYIELHQRETNLDARKILLL